MEYDDFCYLDVESNVEEDFLEFPAHSPPFAQAVVRAQNQESFVKILPMEYEERAVFDVPLTKEFR